MLAAMLWPILAVWMGVAWLVLFSIVGLIAWSAAHLLRDEVGETGEVFCPVQQRSMQVRGVPTHFVTGDPEWASLRRCEQWGEGRVRCDKVCIHPEAAH